MFARIFFICLGLISILWIAYVAIDIIDKENELAPVSVFGIEDGELLIINRVNELNRELISFKSTTKNETLLAKLIPFIKDSRSIYISSNRSHFLIELNVHWTSNKVATLFKNAAISFLKTSKNSFESQGYEVRYKKNYLYFYLVNYTSTRNEDWKIFDRKASACIVKFEDGRVSINDIYIKGQNKVEFQSSNIGKLQGKQINDKDLFSIVLPNSIDNYHFYEKEYFSNQDNEFLNGPMYQWMDKGFVSFMYKGNLVIISDYVAGQDPINSLFDLTKKDAENSDHAHFKNSKLTNSFPINKQLGFYIYNLNDYVVISENQAVCEEIIKENKLGNTLATNAVLLNQLFQGLPILVSERVINNEEKFSRTVYKNKIFETRLNTKKNQSSKSVIGSKSTENQTFSINIDSDIYDFVSFNGKGNCVVLTTNGEIKYYRDGSLAWKKNIPGKLVGKIQFDSASETILISCQRSIHLLDKSGNYVSKIDIQKNHISQEATTYHWKGKLFLVAPFENGEIISYDSKGKKHTGIQTNIPDISAPIDVWISQKKLFFGVRNDQIFKMIQAEQNKEFRSFPLPAKSFSVIQGIELKLFSTKDNFLVVIDQKGVHKNLNHPINYKLNSLGNSDEKYLISTNKNALSLFNSEGKRLSDLVDRDFSNVEFIDVKAINGQIYISVIDDLENNVYLYRLNGDSVLDKPIEGSKKTSFNTFENKIILTTIVDNYIIQYLLNL